MQGDGYTPAVRALRGLWDEAQAGYEAHLRANQAGPGPLARLGSWLASFFPGQAVGRVAGSDFGALADANPRGLMGGGPCRRRVPLGIPEWPETRRR